MNYDLTSLLKLLGNPDARPTMSFVEGIQKPFALSPEDFIRFSESDLSESNLDHKYINALSNAKRALDCELECLLLTIGLGNKRLDFVKKMAMVQSLGLVTPRILRKINRLRNLLEHQFIKPEPEQVSDALDTVILFVGYIDALMLNFKTELRAELDETIDQSADFIDIKLDRQSGLLIVNTQNVIDARIVSDSPDYFAIIGQIIKFSNYWG